MTTTTREETLTVAACVHRGDEILARDSRGTVAYFRVTGVSLRDGVTRIRVGDRVIRRNGSAPVFVRRTIRAEVTR